MRFLIIAFAIITYSLTLPKTFSANFIQTITNKDKNITYKGNLSIIDNKIVWKYTYPTIKIIWIDKKVYIYEPDLYQLTITKKPKTSLDEIIKNAKKIKNNLYLSIIDNKKIYFIYDETLKKVFYKNDLGNYIEIKFFNQKNEVNNSVFKISYPKDVDIIYQN